MISYFSLHADSRREVYEKAFTWNHDHADHVANLVYEKGPAVAPSGSDVFRPELWKGIHWRWFFELNNQPLAVEDTIGGKE